MFKRYYGHIVLAALVTLPIILWLLGPDPGNFETPALLIRAVGKTAAISGLAAYSLMPILSMRHKLFEKLFGGMDNLYRLHRKIGKIVFYVIWAHPVLLFISGIMRGRGLFTIWNWASLLILSGVLAILVFTGIIIMTLYAHLKHQRWIKFHRFFGWLLPLMLTHALLANSRIVNNRPLFIYMMLLGLCGIVAFIYRSVFGMYIQRYKYEVLEVNNMNETVTELVLKPRAIPLVYTPGQFAYLTIQSPTQDTEAHPFSFTTAPNGPYIRFAIKHLGDDTAKYKDIQVGDKAMLEGPYGHFSYMNSRNINQVWIAGGVGITPFLSMARSLSPKSNMRIHLFYAAEEFQDAVFLRELFQIRKMAPNVFDVTVVNHKLSGFVTVDLIKNTIKDLSKYDYLICGPPPMLNILKADLNKNGVDEDKIITEEFSML